MIFLKSVEIKNTIVFEHAKISFEDQILVVRGQNLRSNDTSETNGVGKSLFFDMIPTVIYGHTSLGDRPNKFMSDGSSISLCLEKNDHTYVFEIYMQKSVKYKILIDGVDQQTHTQAAAQEIIDSVWAIPEAEYWSIWFINSLVNSDILRGSSSQRVAFFTDFFQLDLYDKLRVWFRHLLRKIEDEEIRVGVFKSELLKARETLKELGDPDAESVEIYEALLKKHKILDKRKAKIQSMVGIYDTHNRLSSLSSGVTGDVIALRKLLEKLTEDQKSNDTRLQMLEQIRFEIINEQTKVTEKVLSIQRNISDLDFDHELKLLVVAYDREELLDYNEHAYEVQVVEIEDLCSSLENKIQDGVVVNKRIRELTEVALQVTDEDYTEYCRQVKILEMQIELWENVKDVGKQCPVCSSDLDVETLRTNASKSVKKLKWYREQISGYLANKELDGLQPVNTKQLKLELQENRTYCDLLGTLLTSVKQINELMASHKTLDKQRLDMISKTPKHRELSHDPKEIEKQINAIEQDLKVSKEIKEVEDQFLEVSGAQIQSVDYDSLRSKLTATEKLFQETSTLLNDAARRKHNYDVKESSRAVMLKKIKELKQSISELKLVLDKEVVTALTHAYGSKGMKMQKIASISSMLVNNLNKYKHLLFGENIIFSVSVDEQKFDILAERNGKKPTDIRGFSKSEGNRFNLLLMLSLLPLTRNKLNICILDEATSGFSEPNLVAFREKFLPMLHNIVPNVVVVTPDTFNYPGSVSKTVVKGKDGISTIRSSSDG